MDTKWAPDWNKENSKTVKYEVLKDEVLTVTYGGGDLVLGQPVEESLLIVGSVLHVGRSDGQLLRDLGKHKCWSASK